MIVFDGIYDGVLDVACQNNIYRHTSLKTADIQLAQFFLKPETVTIPPISPTSAF